MVRQQPKVVRQQPKVVYRGILGAEKVRPVSGLIQYVTLTKPIRFSLTNWSYIGLNGRKAFVLKTILSGGRFWFVAQIGAVIIATFSHFWSGVSLSTENGLTAHFDEDRFVCELERLCLPKTSSAGFAVDKENRIMIETDGDRLQTSARIYVGLLSFA